jgi:transposase-like protein
LQDPKPRDALGGCKRRMRDGATRWATRDIADVELDQAVALLSEGLSVRDASEELGISKSAVHRLRKRAVAEGRLNG